MNGAAQAGRSRDITDPTSMLKGAHGAGWQPRPAGMHTLLRVARGRARDSMTRAVWSKRRSAMSAANSREAASPTSEDRCSALACDSLL